MIKQSLLFLLSLSLLISCSEVSEQVSKDQKQQPVNISAIKAQSIKDSIIHYFQEIYHWRYDSEPNVDSIFFYNDKLVKYFSSRCQIDFGFVEDLQPTLDSMEMSRIVSDDGKLIIYNWDSELPGFASYRHFNTVVVNEDDSKVTVICNVSDDADRSVRITENARRYISVHAIPKADNDTLYLMFFNNYRNIGIKSFLLDQSTLKEYDAFRKNGESQNEISHMDDFVKDEDNFHLSKDNKVLYVPILSAGVATGRFLIYKFNGNQFVYDKYAK